jgi:hypothetical protein
MDPVHIMLITPWATSHEQLGFYTQLSNQKTLDVSVQVPNSELPPHMPVSGHVHGGTLHCRSCRFNLAGIIYCQLNSTFVPWSSVSPASQLQELQSIGRQDAAHQHVRSSQGISNRATQTDAMDRSFWTVWVAERTRRRSPASARQFGSRAAPNAAHLDRGAVW